MSSKRIFISYRRSDTAGHAGRLYDFLTNDFADEQIFFDTDTIQPGANFEEKIRSELENSDVVLVLIGNQWVNCRDTDGKRRLDDPNDYVRFEVGTALSNNKTVIPVLLQGAQMPSASELPDALRDLSKRNAVKVNDDHWKSDYRTLSKTLTNALSFPTSFKERTLRRNKAWMVATMIGGTCFVIIDGLNLFYGSPLLLERIVNLLAITLTFISVLLVASVIRNMKKEFDRLSWIIIIIGAIGVIMAALGGGWMNWATLTTVAMAALLNLVVADA